jgi:hypothetical protein
LPRIKAVLDGEGEVRDGLVPCSRAEDGLAENTLGLDGIHFKGGRMYRHNMMRINYTTYDVRRAQDTINPKTDHRNVMLLSPESSGHQYEYARVLGIYHVNVIYTGPGMIDYRPQRMEFIWVRWFDIVDDVNVQKGWETAQLDHLKFPPMSDGDAFGFIDPADVLRACHIIQSFAAGRRHSEGQGISECARNLDDWHQYFVNR